MKKKYKIIIFMIIGYAVIALLANNGLNSITNESRPHGSQTDTPELTRNNYLMGFLNEYRSSYDVTYYDINIDFDIEKKSIDGFVTIKAKSLVDIDTLQIDLAKNLSITNIIHENSSVEYSREEDAVMVVFNETINKDKLFNFTVYYNGKPQGADNPPWSGGFTWSKDKNDRDWVAVSCEGEGARIWWPNKDHITEEPDSVRMAFTVPSNLVGVGNGQLRNVFEKEDNKTTYEWFINNPINNYNISVQIGNYVAVQDTFMSGDTTHYMNHYVLDYNEEVGKNYFLQAKEVIRFYEKYFGEYQWWNDGYKLIEVPYLGMEHQSAVTYGNGFSIYNGLRSDSWPMYGVMDPLIIHETGHEWFGNSVTAIDPTHIWIHEGLQVYSEALYFEDKFNSYPVSVDYMKSIKSRIQNKIPIVGPEDENYWALNGDTYMKGAWVMHTLRSAINDDPIWFAILKEFMVENAKSHVNTEDFFEKVREKTGDDYSYFSEQYFYTPNQPELEYYQTDTRFYYRWNNVNDNFTMPMGLLVNGIEKRVLPNQEFQSFSIKKHATIEVMDWKFYVKAHEV
ncbi:MAG: M1 family metallopeptidase [Pelagibacteraceae bacterium]|jgi:aminopeptidase N|nr:M1 family metallopeptidase [Pelagibacteraceae bacterium]MBT6447128.1 M1 family metallopeptidase [Flavobacteriaceae bacterium]